MQQKLLHIVSLPVNILRGYLQDEELLALDRQYVLHVLKLRNDYYRSEEVRSIYQEMQNSLLC